jgi:putative RNA 2'-phosphotransferase
MSAILAELGLALEGTHHRGLDDARNIARIVQVVLGAELGALLSEGAPLAAQPRPSPERLSRFLALVLRHRAGDFGLAPDGEGFVPLAELVAVVERHASPRAGRDDVLRLLADSHQRRFERRGERVRACYGHSRAQPAVSYAAVEPPETLYHGTSPAALAHVRREGLCAMGRQYVHLATTIAEAERVGVRRARSPAILTIRALAAHAAGIAFHAPDAGHFLARSIPPEFIEFPED